MSGDRFSIAVICTANRFRSPLCAGLLRRSTASLPVDVVSAAVTPAGRGGALAEARKLGAPLGVDLDDHVARRLAHGELVSADLVIGFERDHVAVAVIDGGADRGRTFTLPELVALAEQAPVAAVEDPVERARTAVRAAAELRARQRHARPIEELADPVGGPERGYREVAGTLADLSDRLVRVLFGEAR